MDSRLEAFVAECDCLARTHAGAGEYVARAAPRMLDLAAMGLDLLSPEQRRDDPRSYARNALHLGSQRGVSLFALVWRPGQWTPIHDHGTWGVVGVLEGVLEERSFVPRSYEVDDADAIELLPGGISLLSPGSVSTFVPNPDHIHMTGVPEDRETAVSLHVYGRLMNSYHFYDRDAGTRRLVAVEHFES